MRFSFKWGSWNCMVEVTNYRGSDLVVGCDTSAVNAENSSNGFCGIGFFFLSFLFLYFFGVKKWRRMIALAGLGALWMGE